MRIIFLKTIKTFTFEMELKFHSIIIIGGKVRYFPKILFGIHMVFPFVFLAVMYFDLDPAQNPYTISLI